MVNKTKDNRAGIFVLQNAGYESFIPNPLPPKDLVIDDELQLLLSKADGALARLDGVTQVLPNPDLFVAMYIPCSPVSHQNSQFSSINNLF